MKIRIIRLMGLLLALALCTAMVGCSSSAEVGEDKNKTYEFTLSMHDPKTTANAVYSARLTMHIYDVMNSKPDD